MAVMHRTRVAMQLEASVAIAAAFMAMAFIIDWPRAVAGLVLGAVCRFLPYGTIVVPLGVIFLSALFELLYPWFGRTTGPHFWGFFVGLFAVAGTASSLYITIRNLKDRV